jgi:ribonuclease D
MTFVDTPQVFEDVSRKILAAPWAAVDTEADSLHHYTEKLCLLQVSIPDEDFVIDPLAPLPLAEFFKRLAEKDLLFHAADGDVRLIKKAVPFSPKKMFDTLLAAQLLGYEKIGLQNIAERHCGIVLSKTEQKADWSERPLSEKLIRYAANDTHYLKAISEAMTKELKELGRLEWHRQQCARLLETLEAIKPAEEDDGTGWQIKGAKALKGPALTILKELWHWRDGLARQKDKPSFKILNSEYLLEMAKWAAENPSVDVGEWKGAPRNVRGEHRQTINALLKRTQDLPQAVLELPKRDFSRKRWTDKESKLLTELKTVRDKHATELKINASLIATNALLETLAAEKPKDPSGLKAAGFLPWQIETAGDDLLAKLAS